MKKKKKKEAEKKKGKKEKKGKKKWDEILKEAFVGIGKENGLPPLWQKIKNTAFIWLNSVD